MGSTYLHGAHVRANGIRQHYLRYGGAGQPLVLVPGITSPAITWGFVAEHFGRRFDTYVLDVRGRGLSEAGRHLEYGLDALAADLAGFTDALELHDYVLIGHSMGARIVIRAARAHSLRAARIVIVDPPVSGPGRRPYPSPLSWYLDSLRLTQSGAGFESLRAFSPTWTDDQLRLRAEWLPTCDERAIAAAYAGFHEDDIHSDLAHISTPMRLIAAGRGDVIRPDELAEIRALAPQLEICRVDGAGHMIPWDDLRGFFRAFGTFLGRPLEEE
jgi:N-formylmaleamate deformylase